MNIQEYEVLKGKVLTGDAELYERQEFVEIVNALEKQIDSILDIEKVYKQIGIDNQK